MEKTTSNFLHKTPKDLHAVLLQSPKLHEAWSALTPLARNEWICYVTIAKKVSTRQARQERMQEMLLKGKKRPCCWPGCPHRKPAAAKWFSKRIKKPVRV